MTTPTPRQKISFSEEELDEFVYGGIGFKIILDEMIEKRRWSVNHEMIICREEDDTYWRGQYSEGATEYQEYGFREQWGERATFKQVFPKQKVVTIYE